MDPFDWKPQGKITIALVLITLIAVGVVAVDARWRQPRGIAANRVWSRELALNALALAPAGHEYRHPGITSGSIDLRYSPLAPAVPPVGALWVRDCPGAVVTGARLP